MAADRYIRFDVRRPSGGRPLLWPVRVWKVLYPAKRVVKVNIFQQAILGLARARCQDSAEIAELLCLDRELVAFIIATQLIPNGWMTTFGVVTPQGERFLEDAQDSSDELRMGYAYQDAISGNWLPRFTEDIPEIEPEGVNELGYPVFLRDLNSGKKDIPFRLSHSRENSLDMAAIFDAFERYQTDHDHAKQRDGSDDLPARVRIESLSFVEDVGQPMWLWTWVFPDKAGLQPWLVADPFGLQHAASWLRNPLQEIFPKNDGVARYIADAIGEARSSQLSAADWLRSFESQIDLTILADYSWSRKYPLIEGYLTSVLRRNALLASQNRTWQEDVTSLLIETHNLAESILQWMLKAYPPDVRRLPHWKDQREWKDGEAQYYLKYFNLPCLTEDVVNRLAEQKLDQVRAATKRGGSPLKALLFSALLATVDQGRHPIHSLSADELQLSQLLNMTDARNKKGGHSVVDQINKDEAMDYADFVIKWVQIFKGWY